MQGHADLLYPLRCSAAVPETFPSPFNIAAEGLAADAARSLQSRLPTMCNGLHDFDHPRGGKMMGVLVVETPGNELACVSAFSGMLGGQWQCSGFAPPAFDLIERQSFLDRGESTLAGIATDLQNIKSDSSYKAAVQNATAVQDECTRVLAESNAQNKTRRQRRVVSRSTNSAAEPSLVAESREDKRRHRALKVHWYNCVAQAKAEVEAYEAGISALVIQRRELSRQLQLKVFNGYSFKSYSGDTQSLPQLFGDKKIPGGAGDCAAVKLIHFSIKHRLKPLCMAEFWWGSAPASGVRREGSFYPSCRGKCGVILPFMLRGIATDNPDHETLPVFSADQPEVVFEDDAVIVVNKPAGMLSVPGKISHDSVESRLRAQHCQATNATLLVHRLDQATSGLLLAAKNKQAHKHLQLQFQQRQIEKRYCAIVSGVLADSAGAIDLPLRVDIDDRPRQLVCYQHGKHALTNYRVIEKNSDTTRVEFTPVTGRTHQLRLHAAHHLGLNAAIVGDELYGDAAERLYLHAETLAFSHPVTGRRHKYSVPAPF